MACLPVSLASTSVTLTYFSAMQETPPDATTDSLPPALGTCFARRLNRVPPPPQHEGHSRTIIGVERRYVTGSASTTTTSTAPASGPTAPRSAAGPTAAPTPAPTPSSSGSSGGAWVTTLLVLDPGVPSAALESALSQRRQWQRYLRRGTHTLTRPQYQLMWVDAAGGLAAPAEREAMKVVAAAEKYRAAAAAGAGAGMSHH